MHALQLKYRKFWLLNRNYSIPESWDEMSPGLRIFVMRTLISYDGEVAKLIILRKLIGNRYHRLSADQMYELKELLSWCALDSIDKPVWPKLYIAGEWRKCVRPKFEYGSAFQYAMADDLYELYMTTMDVKYLDRMVVNMYMRLSSPEAVEYFGQYLPKIDISTKLSVYLYFASCKQFVSDQYQDWLFSGEDEGNGTGHGWWGLYMDIAESGTFGTMAEVFQSDFHDICLFQKKKVEDYRSQKSNHTKPKTES